MGRPVASHLVWTIEYTRSMLPTKGEHHVKEAVCKNRMVMLKMLGADGGPAVYVQRVLLELLIYIPINLDSNLNDA